MRERRESAYSETARDGEDEEQRETRKERSRECEFGERRKEGRGAQVWARRTISSSVMDGGSAAAVVMAASVCSSATTARRGIEEVEGLFFFRSVFYFSLCFARESSNAFLFSPF